MYDNGEVLQGLNESWTFMGANAMEWGCGLLVFLMISLFASSPARAMPFMVLGFVLTSTSLASLRKSFPDEQRGVRNALCTACGVQPPSIPAPASLQPLWSAAPIKDLPETCAFKMLNLDQVFPSFESGIIDVDEF